RLWSARVSSGLATWLVIATGWPSLKNTPLFGLRPMETPSLLLGMYEKRPMTVADEPILSPAAMDTGASSDLLGVRIAVPRPLFHLPQCRRVTQKRAAIHLARRGNTGLRLRRWLPH